MSPVPGESGTLFAACRLAEASLEECERLMARPVAAHAQPMVSSLEKAVQAIGGVESVLRAHGVPSGVGAGLQDEVSGWRRRLARLATLAAEGSAICHGWASASGIESGYTADGGECLPVGRAYRVDRSL
jgi:hypothetical protein